MKVLLVDADSVNDFANLALMKISASLKGMLINGKPIQVDLIKGIPEVAPLFSYDKVYVSTVFFQSREKVKDYADQFRKYMELYPKYIEVGGSGWGINSALPDDVEHIMPDYSLYDIGYSMGFTSRGCIRKCKFCDVPTKEGTIRDHAPISEFHQPDHKKIILLDNNFLASPKWRENIRYIIDNDLMVNFNQGLDIRLMTRLKAQYLACTQYYNWTFNRRGLHFAFDSPRHEKAVRRGIKILDIAGIKPYRSMFYILVGFNTTPEQDMHRIMTIKELGAKPFVMIYNRNDDHELRRLARWVNGRFHEFLPYDTFKLEGEQHERIK